MITTHDVARKAGVSQATVSRALRDHRGVSPETRARVRAAALALGYVAPPSGRARGARTAQTVAVVSGALDNPFYPALIGPLQEALGRHGLRTVLVTEPEDELLDAGLLADGTLDGVVLTTSSLASPLPADLALRGIPFVLANRTTDASTGDMCTVDNRAGAGAVADLLVELGHTSIGAIMGPDDTSTGRERTHGFLTRLDELGIPAASRRVHRGAFAPATGWSGLEALLADAEHAPTAVFCGNDVIAFGALDAAAGLQLRVPDELTIVGFDDIPLAAAGHVGLTTVAVDLREMAAKTAQLLVARMRDPGRPAEHAVLAPRLVARSTHARPAGARHSSGPLGRYEHDAASAQVLRPWMTAVDGVARAVNAGRPRDAVLRSIAKTACELLGFDFCAVMLADPGDDRLSIAGFHGLTTDYVALVSAEGALQIHPQGADRDSPAARAYRERRTIAVPDTAAASVYGRLSDLAPAQGYRSLLASPLKEGTRATGLLVGYVETPHRFSATEIELAELLAEQTSLVLHTAALRTAQQQVIDDLSAANEQLRDAREQLEWAETQHQRLMQLVLDDAGLDGLTRALADILGASVTVEVDGGKVLQHTTGDSAGPETCTVPIVLSGAHVGRLRVTGLADVPTPLQQRAVERFALVVGVEVLQRRHLLEVRERLSADLLTDLLREDGPAEPDAVVQRAAALGADLTLPHTVVLLTPGDPAGAGVLAVTGRDAAQEVGALIGAHAGHVVVLLPVSHDARAATEAIWQQLRRRHPDERLVATVGQVVRGPEGYARAYRVARGVAGLRAAAGSGVVDVQDAGTVGLLLGDVPAPDLLQFADRTLAGLLADAAGTRGDLLDTLRAWMTTGCSTTAAADRLGVHANTVAYRLRRIADVLECDLQSFRTRMDLQLALTVLDVTGQHAPNGQ